MTCPNCACTSSDESFCCVAPIEDVEPDPQDIRRLTAALSAMADAHPDDMVDPGDYHAGLPTVRDFAKRIATNMARGYR